MRKIDRETLARLAFVNSKKMPQVVNDNGRRKQWVGIGWVDEGPADGTEDAVVGPEASACDHAITNRNCTHYS